MSPVYLRASDDDRERVIDELRRHAGEGRLSVEELEERIERALAARTQGELAVLMRDLPERVPEPPPEAAPRSRPRPELGVFLAVMALLICIWALTGAGYFWPLWPLLGWGFFVLGPGRGLGMCGGRRRRRGSARGTICG
jgi:hypothetical protein